MVSKTVMGIIIIFLLVVSVFLFFRNRELDRRAELHQEITKNFLTYFSLIDFSCNAKYTEYPGILNCIVRLNAEIKEKAVFKERGFSNYNNKTGELGFIILSNDGHVNYDSEQFELYKNHELQSTGCEIKGSIEPGYTCKLQFAGECERGDILEVQYNKTRTYLKTC